MTTTLDQVLTEVTDLVTAWTANQAQFAAWMAGTAAGGYSSTGVSGGGGYYPLTNAAGVTIFAPSILKITDGVTGPATVAAAAQAASAISASAAAASASAAAASQASISAAATAAAASQTAAASSASTASTAATSATASQAAAASSASAASTSQTASAVSESNALTYKNAAATSATAASGSQSAAALSASGASGSAGSASTSAGAASGSASSASTSAGAALASKNAAATSEANASSSASSASGSASAASNSASSASTSASTASTALVNVQTALEQGLGSMLPADFRDGGKFFGRHNDSLSVTTDLAGTGVAYPSVSGIGTVLQINSQAIQVVTQGAIAFSASRNYQVSTKLRVTVDPTNTTAGGSKTYTGVVCYDSSGAVLGDVWGVYPIVNSTLGWQIVQATITSAQIASAFPTTAFIKPATLFCYNDDANPNNSTMQCAMLRFEDVTSVLATAASASAAATSAATAVSAAGSVDATAIAAKLAQLDQDLWIFAIAGRR